MRLKMLPLLAPLFLCLMVSRGRGQASPDVVISISNKVFFAGASSSAAGTSDFFGYFTIDDVNYPGSNIPLLYPKDPLLALGCESLFSGANLLENVTESISDAIAAFDVNKPDTDFGILFDRGECGFLEKVTLARSLGASLMLVAALEDVIFNTSTGRLIDPCAVDCNVASSPLSDIASCQNSDDCESRYCLPAFLERNEDSGAFCCVTEGLIDMNFVASDNKTETFDDIVAAFVNIKDAEAIVDLLISKNIDSGNGDFAVVGITIGERKDKFPFDPSIVLLLFCGVFTVSVATFIAAREERMEIRFLWHSNHGKHENHFSEEYKQKVALQKYNIRMLRAKKAAKTKGAVSLANNNAAIGGTNNEVIDDRNEQNSDESSEPLVEELESVELTLFEGLCLLAAACIAIVAMFFAVKYRPTQVVIALIVFFGLGSIYSTSYFIFRPIIRLLLPRKVSHYKIFTPKKIGEYLMEYFTLESLVGTLLAISLIVVWFIYRHDRQYTWFVQDLLSFAIACMFLSLIGIKSFKTNFIILVGFCIYDIFMVFLTPFFGKGESIMLVVATAGAGSAKASSDALTCARVETEQIPMLFLAPRFGFEGGFGLLGLGDIVIPGLMITYCLRVDYLKAKMDAIKMAMFPEGADFDPDFGCSIGKFLMNHVYWICAIFTYLTALVVTFLANAQGWTINGVPGQPALLYLVPFLMIMFITLSCCRGELGTLWSHNLGDFSEARIREHILSAAQAEDPEAEYKENETLAIKDKKQEKVEVKGKESIGSAGSPLEVTL